MVRGLPISDGGLGAISYTFEFLMGYMGSPSGWRTMPWMVAFFGVLVIPLGLTHIFLVISQPVIVHEWCPMCLLAALIMLPMIPLEVDEVIAMIQHVRQAKKRGDRGGSLWTIFWKGGKPEGCTADERSPAIMEFQRRLDYWHDWSRQCPYDGPHRQQGLRGALVLKLLVFQPSGGLIAAPTTSLPDQIGGERNWDYQYTWLRDAGNVLDALQQLGYHEESDRFIDWLEELCLILERKN